MKKVFNVTRSLIDQGDYEFFWELFKKKILSSVFPKAAIHLK